MKVLSDSTADKLVHVLAGRGAPPPRSVPRPAPVSPDYLNWRITVNPVTGVVSVGKGLVYLNGVRSVVSAATVGTASGSCLVVWESPGGISLTSSSSYTPGSGVNHYRVLGEIVEGDDGRFSVRQHHADPLEVSSGGGGGRPGSDAVPKNLGGTDYNANTDTWTYGDTDPVTGKPTYPVFNPTRLYWQESAHTLWMFRRTCTFNEAGGLYSVSAEVRTAVFTTVAEMP